ncbi:MAG: zinc-binding dehydrogenase, partial [Fimbriimonadaceae bacterium]
AALSGVAGAFAAGADLSGTTVAVVGLGTIGQLSARCFRAAGARVVAGDRSPFRVGVARAAGIDAVPVDGPLADAFASRLPGGADIVVDSTGVESVLERAFALARDKPWGVDHAPAGKVVVQGSYAGDVRFDYHAAFFKEATLLFPRDAEPGDMRRVLELMAAGSLRVADLATEVAAPEDAPRIFAEFAQARPDLLTAAFRWK